MTQKLSFTGERRSEEITALLLPLQGDLQLLIPNVSMAELAPGETPAAGDLTDAQPEWLDGQILWRGSATPVVRWEALTGHVMQPDSAERRFAVMNRLYDELEQPFYAILLQGIPRMLHVSPSSLTAAVAGHVSGEFADAASDPAPGTLFTVDTELGRAVIPDVAWLEKQLAKALSQ